MASVTIETSEDGTYLVTAEGMEPAPAQDVDEALEIAEAILTEGQQGPATEEEGFQEAFRGGEQNMVGLMARKDG